MDAYDDSNIIFVPVGLDENTYNLSYTIPETFSNWIGNNVKLNAKTVLSLGKTHYRIEDIADFDSETGLPEFECWDYFVRDSTKVRGSPDGVLDSICSYISKSNGTQGKLNSLPFWLIPPLQDGNSFCQNPALDWAKSAIAIDPKSIDNYTITLGPFTGTVNVLNDSTGSASALQRTFENFGNPYFTCSSEIFNSQVSDIQPEKNRTTSKISNFSYNP